MCMCTCVYGVCVYAWCVCMIYAVYVYENLTNSEIFIYVVPRAPSRSSPRPPCSASRADIRSSLAPPPSPPGQPISPMSTEMYISRKFLDIFILKI
jgi:hypothetical protein